MDDFSYRLGASGTVLNPNSQVIPFVDITNVAGLDSTELRSTERDNEGVDGGFLDAEFEKMRTITLEGQLIADTYTAESMLDQLKGEWSPQGIVPFYFQHPGVSERLINVKPLGVRYNVDQLRRTGATDVQFMCQAEDPRIYSSALNTVSISQGVAITTGFAFPLGFPFGFGAPVSPESASVYVYGNRPTPPTITIPGPVTNPVIYNDTTGDVMDFQITVGSTESLVIDMYYRTVKLNASLNRRSTLQTPGWFFLQKGLNVLRYRASTSGNPAAVMTYRDAWR